MRRPEAASKKRGHRKRGIDLFILAACLLFAIGAYDLHQHRKAVRDHHQVQGLLVDLRYTPPMNGHRSTLYPVFEYTVDGVTYRQEYQYQAVDGSELSKVANDPELPEGKLKEILQRAAKTQPDFKIGQTYPLQVSREDPEVFFIEGQGGMAQEAKWFVMGGVLLALHILWELISRFAGR